MPISYRRKENCINDDNKIIVFSPSYMILEDQPNGKVNKMFQNQNGNLGKSSTACLYFHSKPC